ncbi:MAG: hypothetical protein LBT09_15490 [Planctomycetaceae bacterium]|jgi:hypothetical protein|nr:hypothetical protein [Planctomycetaceae bacterium]
MTPNIFSTIASSQIYVGITLIVDLCKTGTFTATQHPIDYNNRKPLTRNTAQPFKLTTAAKQNSRNRYKNTTNNGI